MLNLDCNVNIGDNVTVESGRLSYCRISKSPHWFIMVESGTYVGSSFTPDEQIRLAFSYVPSPTYEYIQRKYADGQTKFYLQGDESDILTLYGYLPFLFTDAYVIDTWKLTDEYISIFSKPVTDWKFERFSEYDTYNIFSFVPWNGITDCIGYSAHHYNAQC
jgi:hypothetical protein